jgi:hypothetical protein
MVLSRSREVSPAVRYQYGGSRKAGLAQDLVHDIAWLAGQAKVRADVLQPNRVGAVCGRRILMKADSAPTGLRRLPRAHNHAGSLGCRQSGAGRVGSG